MHYSTGKFAYANLGLVWIEWRRTVSLSLPPFGLGNIETFSSDKSTHIMRCDPFCIPIEMLIDSGWYFVFEAALKQGTCKH